MSHISGDIILDASSLLTLRRGLEELLAGTRHSLRDVFTDSQGAGAVQLAQASAIVVGIRMRDGSPTLNLIEVLRQRFPHLGVFVVSESSLELGPWLPGLAWSGEDEAFCLETPSDRTSLLEALSRRVNAPPPEVALRALWAEWESLADRMIPMYCVRNGFRDLNPILVPAWFGISDKTLRLRIRTAGLPTPGLLRRFGCVLHANSLRHGTSSDDAARRVGLATAKDLIALRARVERRLVAWPRLFEILRRERAVDLHSTTGTGSDSSKAKR